MHSQRHRKKEEEKGYDQLEALYLEKGLTAAGSSHTMGLKAIAEQRAHTREHLQKETTRHRSKFVTAAPKEKSRLSFLLPVKAKGKLQYGHMPPQRKKPDKENPKDRGNGRHKRHSFLG